MAAATGAALIFPAPSFDPLATLEAIHEERATIIYGVPTMFVAQLDHPEFSRFDLTSLRTGTMAGAPCPVEVIKRVVNQMHCPELTIAYGQTRSSPPITMSPVDASVESWGGFYHANQAWLPARPSARRARRPLLAPRSSHGRPARSVWDR